MDTLQLLFNSFAVNIVIGTLHRILTFSAEVSQTAMQTLFTILRGTTYAKCKQIKQ